MEKPRVIIVEDDHDLRQQVVEYLDLSGFSVVGVGSAAELYRRMAVEAFDALVIDIRLPGEDGLTIAAHVRAHGDTAIIMVTAASSIDIRFLAQEAGTDFFLSKPFALSDLVEAINGLLRRKRSHNPARPLSPSPLPAPTADKDEGQAPVAPDGHPPARGWSLNPHAFTLETPDGVAIPLTMMELSLLQRLCSPSQAVVPRGALLAVMGYDPADPSNRNLDATLRRIRVKAKQISGRSLPLRTVHAVGYALTEDIASADSLSRSTE